MKKYNYKHNTLIKVLLYVSSIMAIAALVLKSLTILDILASTSDKTSDIIIASIEMILTIVLLWTLFGSRVILDDDAMYIYIAFSCKKIDYTSISSIIKETNSDTLYILIDVSNKRTGTMIPISPKYYDELLSIIREHNANVIYSQIDSRTQGK